VLQSLHPSSSEEPRECPFAAIASLVAFALAGAAMLQAPLVARADSPAAIQVDVTLCVACHGGRGQGTPVGAPRLAGQNADYMAHALSMFKAGARESPIMQPVAAGLSDTQMRALAVYFSRQEVPIPGAGAAMAPVLAPAGKQLAEAGASNVAPCFSCHGAKGQGTGPRFPQIAGQPAPFVIDRLHEFQARARNAVPQPGTMSAVAATMDESQVQAVAAYLSQLQGG
jgi:cytochrome c553